MTYELAFLKALVITIIIECLAAATLKKFFGRQPGFSFEYPLLLVIVALASALTLPYVWFILPVFLTGLKYVIVSELLVTFMEAIFYKFILKISLKNALFISIICNFASFFIGNILF